MESKWKYCNKLVWQKHFQCLSQTILKKYSMEWMWHNHFVQTWLGISTLSLYFYCSSNNRYEDFMVAFLLKSYIDVNKTAFYLYFYKSKCRQNTFIIKNIFVFNYKMKKWMWIYFTHSIVLNYPRTLIFHKPIHKWKWYKGSLLFWYGLWIIRKLKAVNETGRLPYNFENYAKQKMFWKVFWIGFVLELQGHPLNNHFASWVVFNIFIFVLIIRKHITFDIIFRIYSLRYEM